MVATSHTVIFIYILLQCLDAVCYTNIYIFVTVKDDSCVFPSVIKVEEGGRALFDCRSYGDTKWYFQSLKQLPIFKGYYLNINPVYTIHAGYYFCYGSYTNKPKHFIGKGRLKVYGEKLNITLHIPVIPLQCVAKNNS